MNGFNSERLLGRSGIKVGRIGLAASYGAPAKAFELGFERGCNYFYWGSFRTDHMAKAIRNLAPRNREKLVVALQSYSRVASLIPRTLTKGLQKLKLDYADVLILGWYSAFPSRRVLDAVRKLKEKGLIRAVAISGHNRPMFQKFIEDPLFDIIMVRYNAAHRGAEHEVFPALERSANRPGVTTYTATRWGQLVDPRNTPKGLKTPTAADCYRFALSDRHVDLCMTGPASIEQMEQNLRALEAGPMSKEELDWMRAVGDHVHELSFMDRMRSRLKL